MSAADILPGLEQCSGWRPWRPGELLPRPSVVGDADATRARNTWRMLEEYRALAGCRG